MVIILKNLLKMIKEASVRNAKAFTTYIKINPLRTPFFVRVIQHKKLQKVKLFRAALTLI